MISTTLLTPYTASEALSLAASGITVVMIALALLAILVIILGKTFGKPAAPAPKAAEPAPAPVAPSAPAIPAGMRVLEETKSNGDVNLYEVDDKTAALLMAIVADKLETPLNQLYFRSIKEVK